MTGARSSASSASRFISCSAIRRLPFSTCSCAASVPFPFPARRIPCMSPEDLVNRAMRRDQTGSVSGSRSSCGPQRRVRGPVLQQGMPEPLPGLKLPILRGRAFQRERKASFVVKGGSITGNILRKVRRYTPLSTKEPDERLVDEVGANLLLADRFRAGDIERTRCTGNAGLKDQMALAVRSGLPEEDGPDRNHHDRRAHGSGHVLGSRIVCYQGPATLQGPCEFPDARLARQVHRTRNPGADPLAESCLARNPEEQDPDVQALVQGLSQPHEFFFAPALLLLACRYLETDEEIPVQVHTALLSAPPLLRGRHRQTGTSEVFAVPVDPASATRCRRDGTGSSFDSPSWQRGTRPTDRRPGRIRPRPGTFPGTRHGRSTNRRRRRTWMGSG